MEVPLVCEEGGSGDYSSVKEVKRLKNGKVGVSCEAELIRDTDGSTSIDDDLQRFLDKCPNYTDTSLIDSFEDEILLLDGPSELDEKEDRYGQVQDDGMKAESSGVNCAIGDAEKGHNREDDKEEITSIPDDDILLDGNIEKTKDKEKKKRHEEREKEETMLDDLDVVMDKFEQDDSSRARSSEDKEEAGSSGTSTATDPERISGRYSEIQRDRATRAIIRKMLRLKMDGVTTTDYIALINRQQRIIEELENKLKYQQEQLELLQNYGREVARSRSIFEQPLPNLNHPNFRVHIENEVKKRTFAHVKRIFNGQNSAEILQKFLAEKRLATQSQQQQRVQVQGQTPQQRLPVTVVHHPTTSPQPIAKHHTQPQSNLPPPHVRKIARLSMPSEHSPSPTSSRTHNGSMLIQGQQPPARVNNNNQPVTRVNNFQQIRPPFNIIELNPFEKQEMVANRVALCLRHIPDEALLPVSTPETVFSSNFGYPYSISNRSNAAEVTKMFKLAITTTTQDFIGSLKLHARLNYSKPPKNAKIRLCTIMESAFRANSGYKDAWWTSNPFPLSEKEKMIFSVQFKNGEGDKQKMSPYERIAMYAMIEIQGMSKLYVTPIVTFMLLSPQSADVVQSVYSVENTLDELPLTTASTELTTRTLRQAYSQRIAAGQSIKSANSAGQVSSDVDMITLDEDEDDIIEVNGFANMNGTSKSLAKNASSVNMDATSTIYTPLPFDDNATVPDAGISFNRD